MEILLFQAANSPTHHFSLKPLEDVKGPIQAVGEASTQLILQGLSWFWSGTRSLRGDEGSLVDGSLPHPMFSKQNVYLTDFVRAPTFARNFAFTFTRPPRK